MHTKHRWRQSIFFISLVVVFVLCEWSCEPKDPGVVRPNQPPVAKLANVPVDDPATVPDSARFTKSPLVNLYWVGNDADGYVVAFMYRWSFKDSNASAIVKYRPWTTILNYVTFTNRILVLDIDPAAAPTAAPQLFKFFSNTDLDPESRNPSSPNYNAGLVALFNHIDEGDTVQVLGYRLHASNPANVAYPVHKSPNKGTFIFESDDYANRHKFEIKAIDNESAVSAVDSIRFWNRKVDPPRIVIVSSPRANDTVFVLQNVTLTWPGIVFTYQATDKNSRTLEYSWHLDNQDWSPWSQNNAAYVTASALDTPYTGPHRFIVRARNEFGSITPPDSQPSRSFFSVFPPFAVPGYVPRVLLVNVVRADARDTPPYPSSERVTKFYTDIFDSLGLRGGYDVWSTHDRGHPKAVDLANYSTIFMFPDVLPFITPLDRQRMVIPARRYAIYMDAGGNMIMNGLCWPILLQIIQDPESLLVRHMSIATLQRPLYITNTKVNPPDFIGAFGNGRLGYPDVTLDSTKLDSVWRGGLANVSVCRPQGFGEVIYRYNSRTDSIFIDQFTGAVVPFENGPLGLRYLGATYKSVYFGFPLYRIPPDLAKAVLRKALQDVGHL